MSEYKDVFAVILYPVPVGPEEEMLEMFVMEEPDAGPVRFGRGGECEIRIGNLPLPDLSLPSVAGAFVPTFGRGLIVECGGSDQTRALELHRPDLPPELVAPGKKWGSSDTAFKVKVSSEERSWVLQVKTRPLDPLVGRSANPPTKPITLWLDPLDLAILEAYCAPLRAGRQEPATHNEVSALVHYSYGTVRSHLAGIASDLLMLGVPLLQVTDNRIAVTEAVMSHRFAYRVRGT